MSPESQKLAQALLDHHKKVCRLQSQAGSSIDSCLIAYGDLCEQAGLPHLKPTVGRFLVKSRSGALTTLAALNALAVNHDTQRPGRGYDGAPGCSLTRWQDDAMACIKFATYPTVIS
jgi:hypothetical protein